MPWGRCAISLAMLGYVSRFDQAVANVMDDATAAAEAGDTLRATYQRPPTWPTPTGCRWILPRW